MLEMSEFRVQAMALGGRTEYGSGQLRVGVADLESLSVDPALVSVRWGVARPGEPTRIVNVLDVVEPRVKPGGRGRVFPGVLGPGDTVGRDRTHRLSGVAVVATGIFPDPTDPFLGQKDCVIEMSGPGSAYSPFARTCNLVLEFTPGAGVSNLEFGNAVRRVTLKVAEQMAAATLARTETPTAIHRYDPAAAVAPDLPRVVYICETVSHGPLKGSYLYGRDFTGAFPTMVGTTELMDGALVAADYHYAGQRTVTYFLQHNSIAEQLWSGHGRTHNFVGIILSGIYRGDQEKEMAAQFAANLAELLGAQGAVISPAAGGNALIDALYLGRACERRGIHTAITLYEMSDASGGDPSLVDFTRENNLLISTGNREEPVAVPAPEVVYGGTALVECGKDAAGPLRLAVRDMCAATCHQGAGYLTSRAF